MMKDIPSVTSTCPSGLVFSRVSTSRSNRPPIAATAIPAPSAAARFHLVCLASVIAATAFTLTTIDPVTVTIFAVVLGAAAVPLTYFPILIVANDARVMGQRVNRRWANAAGTFFLTIMVVVSLVSVPLLIITKAGQ